MVDITINGGLAHVWGVSPDEIRRRLTFQRYDSYHKTYSPLACYSIKENRILVPRWFPHFNRDMFGQFTEGNVSVVGLDLPVGLRRLKKLTVWGGLDQEKFVTAAVRNVGINGKGGYAIAPCGTGKTFMGLETIRRLGRSALIVVGRRDHMNQWCEEARGSFTKDGNPWELGQYWSDRKDTEPEVVVGVIDSLLKIKDPGFYRRFGTVIFDECQHLPAYTWLLFFARLRSRYIMGFTATLVRTDGLENIFRYLVGGVLCAGEAQDFDTGRVYQIIMPPVEIKLPWYCQSSPSLVQLAKAVAASEVRDGILANVVLGLYQKGRHVLVFGTLKDHLRELCRMVVERGVPEAETGYYFGGMKQEKLKESAGKRITFVTYQMGTEGMNIPRKDALLCATPPPSNLKQLKGRISRYVEGKPDPVVIDPLDYYSVLRKRGMRRINSWRRLGMEVLPYTIGEQYHEIQNSGGGQRVQPQVLRGESSKDHSA